MNDFNSPLVRFIGSLILWLREHSPHGLLKRRIDYLASDPGIELWALSFFGLSIVGFLVSPLSGFLSVLVIGFAVVRLVEIVVNAIHVTIFHGFLDKKPLAGHRRIVLLLIFNYVEIIFWFAAIYLVIESQFDLVQSNFNLLALFYSFSTASGFGNVQIAYDSSVITSVSLVEASIGLFMAIAVLARFVSLLPAPPIQKSGGS